MKIIRYKRYRVNF